MTLFLRAGVMGIAALLFMVPLLVSAQTCAAPADTGKKNGALTCQCIATRCSWIPGPASAGGTTGSTQETQVNDPSTIINNQVGAPNESTPVTAAEFNRKPPQKFTPLAGIPGITNLGDVTMPQLLNALYRMLIVIGALIAVLKITIAGLKYMGSDNFGSKASAKEDITAALLGLLILLAAVLIINTVMGSVNLNILQQAPQIPYPTQPPPSLIK